MNKHVIPVAAKVVAGILFTFALCALIAAVLSHPHNFFAFPVALIALIVAAYSLMVGYVYGDARRRGMRYVMWTWLAILIPNGIGIILYFILREPVPNYCTKCGAAVRHGFAYCPRCGTAMAATCPQCHKVLEAGWTHCAHCGAKL